MTRTLCAFLTAVAVLVMLSAPPAFAEPYWIAWEGDTFPEEGEWNRAYGNWDGPGEGQAYRSLHDGVLTIDSLHDQGVYDYYWLERPGAIDPDPGETFVMEWSLQVDVIDPAFPSYPFDPSVGVRSDEAYAVGLTFGLDSLYSLFEHVELPIDMSTLREFRFTSSDMRTYSLFVDDILFYEGAFVEVVSESRFAWGNGTQGCASLVDWDYVRYGVLPEPQVLTGFLMSLALCRGRRR